MPCQACGVQSIDATKVRLLMFDADLRAVWVCPSCGRHLWVSVPESQWPEAIRRIGSASRWSSARAPGVAAVEEAIRRLWAADDVVGLITEDKGGQ